MLIVVVRMMITMMMLVEWSDDQVTDTHALLCC